MNLKNVTISGANEHTEIKELVDLLYKYPKTELGIQISPTKANYKSERYKWIEMLHNYAWTLRQNLNVAFHVNPGWVEQVCDGLMPLEMLQLMALKNPDGSNMVKRIQLNFLIGREKAPDIEKLDWVIGKLHHYRVILTYNEANKQFIDRLYLKRRHNFELLFDSSHGEGKSKTNWEPPIYSDIVQGYSGGLSPENVEHMLINISLVNVGDSPTWIDAEGKLKGDDGHLDLKKAEAFLKATSKW